MFSRNIPSQNTAEILNVLFEQFLKKHTLTSKQTVETMPEAVPLKSTQKINEKPLPNNFKTSPLPVEVNKKSRYIPAPIRRLTYQRAKGRCEHTDQDGARCSSRYQLEFDHIVPFALNGSNEAENIRIVCSKHNSYFALSRQGVSEGGMRLSLSVQDVPVILLH